MGNWNINIQGIGCHHNNVDSDANEMTKEFVKKLLAAGHAIEGATFTHGGKEDCLVKFDPSSVEFEAGRQLAIDGKPLPDLASDAAKAGYASVPK